MGKYAFVPTMTINELVLKLRELGIKTTNVKVREAIKQGKYPFAISIEMDNCEFEIYKRIFDEWVAERAYMKEELET